MFCLIIERKCHHCRLSEFALLPGIEDEKVAQKTPENVIRLPDIKEAKKKKQTEEELARMAEEEEKSKVKIKRSDKEAFRRVRMIV